MVYYLLLFLSASLCMAGCSQEKNTDTKTEEKQEMTIDQKIEELKKIKLGFEAKATRYNNKAQQLQFQQGQLQEAKRLFKLAELNQQLADDTQQQIDALEKQKIS